MNMYNNPLASNKGKHLNKKTITIDIHKSIEIPNPEYIKSLEEKIQKLESKISVMENNITSIQKSHKSITEEINNQKNDSIKWG